jgi:hypothetical protein
MSSAMAVAAAVLGVGLVAAGSLLGWALAHAMVTQRRLTRTRGVFRCNVKVVRGHVPCLPSRWRRWARWRGYWSHEVLVLRHGLLRPTVCVLPVRFPQTSITSVSSTACPGLGPTVIALTLLLDDDAVVEVATSPADRDDLAGPFLVVAVEGLPPGLSDRHEGR